MTFKHLTTSHTRFETFLSFSTVTLTALQLFSRKEILFTRLDIEYNIVSNDHLPLGRCVPTAGTSAIWRAVHSSNEVRYISVFLLQALLQAGSSDFWEDKSSLIGLLHLPNPQTCVGRAL